MNETSKTRRLWGPVELAILAGKGIDIGCGGDPVTPDARGFDKEDGDANEISKYVHEQFDFVYASHCLEHLRDPRRTLLDWWALVREGGHLFFIVPDEDLYELGVFPSRFNPDHKATFTISKQRSWSPVSHNVLDLARSLPGGQLVSLELQDEGYDRRFFKHGPAASQGWATFLLKAYRRAKHVTGIAMPFVERFLWRFTAVDQTRYRDALAQIQCIVRKEKTEVPRPPPVVTAL